MKLRERHLRSLLSLYLTVVYLFGIVTSGAWSDDYAALLDPSAVGLHALRDSRPISGFSISVLFSVFDSINQLPFLRFFGLLGLILLNNEIWIRLREYPKHRIFMIISTFGLTLPSFQFAAHWAIAFVMSWATFLGLLGLRLFSNKNLKLRGFGLLILIISLLTYPLVVFFIFPVVFVEGLMSKDTANKFLGRFAQPFLYLSIGTPASYLVSIVIIKLNGTSSNARVELVSFENVPEKITWFFTRPWALSFRPFLISSPSVIEMVMFVTIFFFLILTLMVFYYRSLVRGILVFCIFNFVIIVSVLPLLIVSQNQIDVRFLGANTWLVLVTLLFLFSNFISEKTLRAVPKLISFGGILLLVFGFWSVNDRYVSFIQPTFLGNQNFIESELVKCVTPYPDMKIDIIRRSTFWEGRQLLGFYSQTTDLESDWVPEGAVSMYLDSIGIGLNRKPNLVTKSEKEGVCQVILDRYRVLP